jgi:alpha-acetolactate decarboxylase
VVTEELVPAASFDFPRLNFACRIKANYVPCLQLAEPTQKEFVLKETLTITAMAQYENYLLLGTVNGEVLILQSDFFRRREEEKCRVWSYLISDSPISNLVAFEDRLLVSTEAGSSVTELCLKAEQSWMVTNAAKDPYSEQMTGEMI